MFVTIKISFYFQVHNFHLGVIIYMGKVALQNERLLKTAQNLQFRKLNLTNFDIVALLKKECKSLEISVSLDFKEEIRYLGN